MTKIGVLAGTFDPVHLGHIKFIERTITDKELDKVVLLIEKKPIHKPVFTSYENRLKMVELAIKNRPSIQIYDCQTESYPISNCLPEIKKSLKPTKFYLLVGHDVAEHIKSWPQANYFLDGVELEVAERNDGITSGKIRQSLSDGKIPVGLDPSVLEYIKQNNLYQSETTSGA